MSKTAAKADRTTSGSARFGQMLRADLDSHNSGLDTVIYNLYQGQIRAWAEKTTVTKRISRPDITVNRHSHLCGSKITVDLVIKNDVVIEAGFEISSCILGRASTAMLIPRLIGRDLAIIRSVRADLFLFLHSKTPPKPLEWNEFEYFRPARAMPMRHSAILLPFDAAIEGLTSFDTL